MKTPNRLKFENSFCYGSLMDEGYKLSSKGFWEIFGEDPNCDFGGCHSKPKLCNVEGTLDDVINYAVELPKFWTWGGGGAIVPFNKIIKVDKASSVKRKAVEEEIKNLQAKVVELQKNLNS